MPNLEQLNDKWKEDYGEEVEYEQSGNEIYGDEEDSEEDDIYEE